MQVIIKEFYPMSEEASIDDRLRECANARARHNAI